MNLKRGRGRGTWRPFNGIVHVSCPKCGITGVLDHEIDQNGKVTPSLVCPNGKCDFHEYVILEGWGVSNAAVDQR